MAEVHRWVRVSGYVQMALDDAVGWFEGPDVDRALEESLAHAVGAPAANLQVRGAAPVRVSASNAHVGLSWRIDRDDDDPAQGSGSIALLRVQSGQAPITEVLVSVVTDEGDASRVAGSLHRFVDHLLARLPSLPA